VGRRRRGRSRETIISGAGAVAVEVVVVALDGGGRVQDDVVEPARDVVNVVVAVGDIRRRIAVLDLALNSSGLVTLDLDPEAGGMRGAAPAVSPIGAALAEGVVPVRVGDRGGAPARRD